MSKRVLSLLMALALCFSMLPAAALAETVDAAAEKTQNGENIADVFSVGGDTVLQSGEMGDAAVKAAQALIDALPDEVTADNAEELQAQLIAIDEALEKLDDEQLAALDMAHYEALCEALAGLTAGQAAHPNHPVCGEVCNHIGADGTPMHKDVEWTAVSSFSDQYVAAGHYYLTDNVEVGLPLVSAGNVDLCLNGHTIANWQTADVISVNVGHAVNLCDCDTTGEGGKIYGDGADKAHGVYLNGGTLNMYGGTVTAREYGVYVAQDNSTFNMYGGTITGSGTGVYMKALKKGETSAFNMTGGSITGNGTGNEDVGGVYVGGSGTFRMGGNAKITNNNKSERIFGAGGVYVAGETGTFEMGGDAEISGNGITIKEGNRSFTSAGAGGVYVRYGAFKMSGNAKVTDNSITNNSSKGVSGGVYIDTQGAMSVSGNANVTSNTGGNVYLTDGKSITADGTLGETAAIGVSIPALEEGGVFTVATSVKEGDEVHFSDDANCYKKKFANGSIIFDNGKSHEHPVCGDKNCEDNHSAAEFNVLTVNNLGEKTLNKNGIQYYYRDLPAGNWYLTGDFKPDATLRITGKVNLCLNGYSIIPTNGDCVIRIDGSDSADLTLCDCRKGDTGAEYGKITTNLSGRGVSVTTGSFTMYGGNITGNGSETSGYNGAGVFVDENTAFTMHGGTISGNNSNTDAGGGVYNIGTFNLIGGSITGNTANNYYGGGVYNVGTFNLTGGSITGNKAKYGGGVYNMGSFTMSGGTIGGAGEADANTATVDGGGVYVSGGERSFTMTGGTITGNTAANGGGGVFTGNGSSNMSGGEISGNTARNGGGVYVDLGSAFTLTEGTIGGNIAKSSGGGVGVHGGSFTLKNGSISGNTANSYGGGVDVSDGSFAMSGGSITGNSVTDPDSAFGSGAGVDVYKGIFTMTGGSITGNSATNNGGGVEVISTGTMIVSGSVQITNNWRNGTPDSASGVYVKGDNGKANNLYIGYNRTVTIGKDGLAADARIGFITSDEPTSGSPIKIVTNATEEESYYAAIFIPEAENSSCTITKKTDNALYLSAHEHSWQYTADDTTHTITAKCSKCSLGGGSVTLKAPADSSLTYDGKEKAATYDGGIYTGDTPTISYVYELYGSKYRLESGAPKNANTYTASIELGGAEVSVDYTIEKAKLTVTANENTITYGDTPVSKGVTYKGFVNGEDENVLTGSLNYTFSYPRYGDTGLYIIVPGGLTSLNYDIETVPGTLTVKPREVTLAWNNTANRTYGDGKTVTATAGNFVNGDEIDVDVTDGDKTEVGTHTATATGLTGSKAGNYKLPDDTAKRTITYSVSKGKLENKELTMPVYKGVHKTYEYDFANELPTLAEGLTFGNIKYIGTLSDEFNEIWISKDNVVLNGSVLSITTYAWDKGAQILEYVVTVKSDNYEDFTMTLKVNAKDKTVVNLSESDITIIGWPYGSAGVNKPEVRNVPSDARPVSSVYMNKATGEVITPTGMTDAGTYTVKVRYESDDTVYIGATDFKINPRHLFENNIEVPAGVTTNKTYDGTTNSDLTELWIDEDMLAARGDEALRIVGAAEYARPNVGATMLIFTTNGTIRLSDPSSSAKPSNYCTNPTNLTKTIEANILPRELAFTVDSVSKTYGEGDADADVRVTFTAVAGNSESGLVNGEMLVQGVDYDVNVVFSKTEVGEDSNVRVTVTLKDTEKARNYKLSSSEIIATGTISSKPIGDVSLTLDKNSFTYNGSEQKPSVTLNMNGNALEENKDYTVVYPADATNIGAKEIKIIGKGNFSGEATVNYSIEKNAAAPAVTLSSETFTYDGSAKEPSVTVVVEGRTLEEGTDYDVAYSQNINAGNAAEVKITSKGNYGFSEVKKNFTINKAEIRVKPKDITKVYGDTQTFELVESSNTNLITAQELADLALQEDFSSDGKERTAAANESGYDISVSLRRNETENLSISVDGTGKLKVTKAPLTIKVKNVSREYGAENPELEAEFNHLEFKNGEDESVLGGELRLSYDSDIDSRKEVGNHRGVTKAEGLTSNNYEITYVPGDVEITPIRVNVSAGMARSSYITAEFDRVMEGLAETNFIVTDSDGNRVAVTGVTESQDSRSYTLNGGFAVGKAHTVKVELSGSGLAATHVMATDVFVITPISSRRNNGGGSGSSGGTNGCTVSFETNGGSRVLSRTVTENSAIKEPTEPTKEGYDFAGWYADKELKTKYDFSAKVTKNITLYAAWTEKDADGKDADNTDNADSKDNTGNQIILTIGEKDAKVFGAMKSNDVAPKIVNDRTMLPARFVAENLGAEVSWNGEEKLVTIKGKNLKMGEDVTILITIGAKTAFINGREIELDSPAFIESDRTYTPVRFISEELGAGIEWISEEQKVVITMPKAQMQQEGK